MDINCFAQNNRQPCSESSMAFVYDLDRLIHQLELHW